MPGAAPRRKGDGHERRARDVLLKHDWYVIRAAGSLGPADLVALRADHKPWLISCKATQRPYLIPVEWTALYDTATRVGAVPVLCFRPLMPGRRMGTAFVALTADARGTARQPPIEPLDFR